MKTPLYLLTASMFAMTLTAFGQNKDERRAGEAKAGTSQAAATTNATKAFTFNGGTLREFISEFKRQLSMDLYDSATIDPKALGLRIPKMKIPPEAVWSDVLYAYNHLSIRTEDSLGRWVISPNPLERDDTRVDAIIFMPPKNMGEEAGLKVKAFSLDKLSEEQQKVLHQLIHEEADRLRRDSQLSGTAGNYSGDIRYHSGTGLLIASGGKEYVELAGTIIEAYREAAANRRIADPE
jgi:hypothetical protein